MTSAPTVLPIDAVVGQVLDALENHGQAVLQAPPGAGKTSRMPLALLDAPWLGEQRIVMLEPRRVAARAAAARLAGLLGDKVGGLVGYRMRHDTRVSNRTRIEVVTEGVLTRLIQTDPSLSGIGVVVFDEFHERSLHADLGLAFTIEARSALRPDLRLLVMSATLDGALVSAALGDAPVVTSEGREYPVDTHYRPPPAGTRPESHMAGVIAEISSVTTGDILAFLPGAAWIRRTQDFIGPNLSDEFVVTPLFGMLSPAEQDRALRPDPEGRRKVILATDIAETSLTIDGVRSVVDGGQRRSPRFDPRSGLTRLRTTRISRASADQRRGRAGRQAPGACYRLWSERDHEHLEPFDSPEIASADLSGLRLQLARWGANAEDLTWLDPPPAPALDEATELLRRLGALDKSGRISAHGDAMIAVGAEPRLAHMMVASKELGLGGLACDVAGLLSGRDPLTTRSVDMRERLAAMHGPDRPTVRRQTMKQARTAARRWRRQLKAGSARADSGEAGVVLALAFGDRIGQQRGGSGSYQLSSGRGAELPDGDPLRGAPYLAVADVDGEPKGGRIYLAAPLDRSDLDRVLDSTIHREPVIEWDSGRRDVVAEHQTRLGALVLKREPIAKPAAEALSAAWATAVAVEGLALLNSTDQVERWRCRVGLLRRVLGNDWPDVGDDALLSTTQDWLAPHLAGARRRKDLRNLNLAKVLGSQLDWRQGQLLDELAPTHITVPSGSSVRVDYQAGNEPVLAVRLQELFGLTDTPTIVGGRVPVVLHLLSPAQQPVQVTTDLANFWRETYPQVKAELMGRYPKHHWPDDPMTAQPTNRTKKRR